GARSPSSDRRLIESAPTPREPSANCGAVHSARRCGRRDAHASTGATVLNRPARKLPRISCLQRRPRTTVKDDLSRPSHWRAGLRASQPPTPVFACGSLACSFCGPRPRLSCGSAVRGHLLHGTTDCLGPIRQIRQAATVFVECRQQRGIKRTEIRVGATSVMLSIDPSWHKRRPSESGDPAHYTPSEHLCSVFVEQGECGGCAPP